MMMKRTSKILLAGLMLFAGEAAAATCTSLNSGGWGINTTWSCNKIPGAGDDVIILSPHSVNLNGNNRSAASLTIDAGATLVDAGQDLTVSGNVVVNGTYDGSGNNGKLIMTGGAGTTLSGTGTFIDIKLIQIDGNITIPADSNFTLTLGSEIRANGTLNLNGTISGAGQNANNRILRVNNGGTVNIGSSGVIDAPNSLAEIRNGGSLTNSGSVTLNTLDVQGTGIWTNSGGSCNVPNQTPAGTCVSGGGGGGGGTCNSLLPSAPAGGNPIASGGTTTLGNNANVNGVAVTVTPGSNTILDPATTTTWNSGSAPLPPPPSPIPASTVQTVVGAGGLAAGSYGDVRVNTGTGIFTGGDYFINELYVAPGATAQLAPGNYYVNKLTIGSNKPKAGGNLAISPSGLVKIYVKTNAKKDAALYGGSSGIWDGSTVNVGGDPGNLQILLYDTVTYFEIGTSSQLTGFVVQPVYSGAAGNKAIDVHNNVTITGGVYTAGWLNIKNNVTFNYTPQVAAAIQSMSQCGPHHLKIQHSGTGVTCTPGTLTIVACADAACSSLYTGGVTGTMTATGTPTVNWVGGTGFSIDASGSVTKDVQVTTAGTVDWGTSGESPAPANATECFIGATPSCSFTSALAGFLFDVPNHVSDTVQNITVSAVKQADNSLACVPAFASTSKTVNFACAYSNPASGTLPVTVGGSAVSCGVSGGVSLSFDASGIASTTVRYADAGQIALTANYSGSGGSETGLVMTGNDPFIAAPASFSVSNVTAGPIKAGNDFSATVTALNASGNATPNFGNETAPEGVTLTPTLVSPVGGTNPALGNGVIAGATFSNGVATLSNLNWGEVGNITLDAALTSGSYLGSGLSATGSAAAGVFIPDHFSTEVLPVSGVPMPCPTGLTCPTLYNGFVYSGQSFSVRVTALNLGGGTTSNYDGTLGFSKDVTLAAWDALGSTTTQNPGGGTPANNSITAASFTAGVATTATPAYTFAATTAPTDIYLRATDTDGATSLRTIPASSVEGGVKVVSGRVKVSNAYGSSLLPLTLPTTVQYYDGTRWLVSATDSITTLSLPANLTVGAGPGTTTTSSTPPGWVFASGSLSINLSAPGAGASGSAFVVPTIDGGSPGNPPLPIISGTATFGIYKGNNEMIYRREAY